VDLTSLTRLPEKASTNRAELDDLLDSSRIAHLGFVVDEQPVVLPTAVARDGDLLLVHGSTGSRWLRHLPPGAPAAAAVTEVGGLVVARSAFESSMHYRSAVIFGTCSALSGDAKRRALDVLTDSLLPGRVGEVRPPAVKELAATLVLAMPITTWSLKVSAYWPEDPPADVDSTAWAGVVPLQLTYGDPLDAPDLTPGIPVPPSVRGLRRARRLAPRE
jgi:uncharacterized protein